MSAKKPTQPAQPSQTGDQCQKLVSMLCKAVGTCKDSDKRDTCKSEKGNDIKSAAEPSGGTGSGGGGGSIKPDTVSYEIKFVIVSSGNVTPTWKLVRFSANTASSPLFNVGRTRTHDLIITIGPNSNATDNVHLANQIGSAVSNANRAALTTP